MPNGTRVPERGAVVVAHIYPNGRFAWLIRTGPAVDRVALAGALDVVGATTVYYKAQAAAHDRGLTEIANIYLSSRVAARYIRLVRQALVAPTRRGLDGTAPKGEDRIAVEMLLIRTILEAAAAARRGN